MAITRDMVVRRGGDVLQTQVKDEMLMMSAQTGRYFGLNGTVRWSGNFWNRQGQSLRSWPIFASSSK